MVAAREAARRRRCVHVSHFQPRLRVRACACASACVFLSFRCASTLPRARFTDRIGEVFTTARSQARPHPRRAEHTTWVAGWSGCGLHAQNTHYQRQGRIHSRRMQHAIVHVAARAAPHGSGANMMLLIACGVIACSLESVLYALRFEPHIARSCAGGVYTVLSAVACYLHCIPHVNSSATIFL